MQICRATAALLLGALATLPGCYSKITAYEGNFTLGYMSPIEQVENFVKPIAPGAKLDIVVFANGTNDKLTILEVTSSKPGVLEVAAVRGETLTVTGVAPGATELTIAAKGPDGKRLTDKMFFHVAKPATHELEHSCTDQPKAVYVRGSEVALFHNLATSDKRRVVGYDYVPITVSPKAALELVAQPQAGTVYRYKAMQALPSVTVTSDIDGKSLEARIVEPSEIKSGSLLTPERIIAGQSAYAVAVVESQDGTVVCSQTALTRAKSLTPEICKVSARLEDSTDDTNREQLAEIQALKFGTCEVEMTLPELGGGGIVLRKSLAVGRVEYPRGNADEMTRPFPRWPLWVFFGLAQALGLGMLVKWRRSGRSAG